LSVASFVLKTLALKSRRRRKNHPKAGGFGPKFWMCILKSGLIPNMWQSLIDSRSVTFRAWTRTLWPWLWQWVKMLHVISAFCGSKVTKFQCWAEAKVKAKDLTLKAKTKTKDLSLNAKAKTRTWSPRPRPRTWHSRPRPRPRTWSQGLEPQGQGQGHTIPGHGLEVLWAKDMPRGLQHCEILRERRELFAVWTIFLFICRRFRSQNNARWYVVAKPPKISNFGAPRFRVPRIFDVKFKFS